MAHSGVSGGSDQSPDQQNLNLKKLRLRRFAGATAHSPSQRLYRRRPEAGDPVQPRWLVMQQIAIDVIQENQDDTLSRILGPLRPSTILKLVSDKLGERHTRRSSHGLSHRGCQGARARIHFSPVANRKTV
jgi:hypothetical protein